ncbi:MULTISPECIES: hypothetical protein [unclassified Brevundimonas]|uniref:hypothetical protein n=1 Tax=unclassified Brevundimonas TaxID=2622653 RepID=UPI0006F84FC5|nr:MULTISPECIES: hypothetical protein [unclassified Brevundimonas]KQY93086.1 hypothetical protein ASD25_17880 [Brevundimonas sp. Root1423]KRA27145.1 hypothetical protein ASD59_07565 [Brevundimonas sp. Root608]
MTDQLTFSLDEAIKAQRALREALDLGEERFEVSEFVEMISDEIEQMRDAGKTNDDIAAIVTEATGHRMDPSDLDRHYIAPEDRHGGQDR